MRAPVTGALAPALAAAALSSAAAGVGAPAIRAAEVNPTSAQITRAVHDASRSHTLWATINTCDPGHDHAVGVRGQMPALPFPSHLAMRVSLLEWSPTRHRYVRLAQNYRLGGGVFSGAAVVQDGVRLTWSGPATVRARITFRWFRDGRLLGSTSRLTAAGHRDAHGTPPGTSLAACTIRP
ncbi:MAG TPA: hypothetical protein VFN48_02100 [Solirubrobacteraceae bacterium]|nr:hypothetical protein [Solirubrobacteraceae bacterium]